MVLSDFCDAFDEAVDRRLHRERPACSHATPAKKCFIRRMRPCSTASVTKQTSSDGRKRFANTARHRMLPSTGRTVSTSRQTLP